MHCAKDEASFAFVSLFRKTLGYRRHAPAQGLAHSFVLERRGIRETMTRPPTINDTVRGANCIRGCTIP